MAKTRGYIAAVMGLVVALAGAPESAQAACANASVTLTGANAARVSSAVVCRVNEERAKRGRRRLTVDRRLVSAARSHSQDMVRRGYFSHTSPGGLGPTARARRAGYRGGVGENIGAGGRTANQMMRLWLRSSGHRRNILSTRYRRIGVGAAVGGEYGTTFTQIFGTR